MSSDQLLKELDSFSGREAKLREITRYSLYSKMWYRTNLWTHTRRVAWIVEELIPLAQKVFKKDFDPEKAIALALVHDDPEMIIGDIQAGNKAKMSEAELKKVHELEQNAAEILAKKYPHRLGNYVYEDLLNEAARKGTLESLVVSWADKYDAFGEALHELFAGNKLWTVHVNNEYGKIDLPTEYYMKYFRAFETKFSQSKELFLEKDTWFSIPDEPNILDIVNKNTTHTKSSLGAQKGYKAYDQWVALTLKKGTQEDTDNLFVQKEE